MYEAKKKLASINKAEEKAVSADDLIRFAHRISASGAVAAPSTWVPGMYICSILLRNNCHHISFLGTLY